jgi:hypothetical protein
MEYSGIILHMCTMCNDQIRVVAIPIFLKIKKNILSAHKILCIYGVQRDVPVHIYDTHGLNQAN